MARKLSLAFFTLFDCGPVDMIRVAAETGYDMVGLRLLPPVQGEAPYPLMRDAGVRRETLAALKETGIAVCDVEIVRLKPETKTEEFERFLEIAAELGARHVLVVDDDPDASRFIDSFAALCRLSRPYGLTADLEFMPWTKAPDLRSARAFVEKADEPNGGVLIDALHFDRSKSTLEEVLALPRHLVHYAQFCDGPLGYDPSDEALLRVARGERLFPGEGGIDCVSLAKAIPEDIVISLEAPNRELAKTVGPKDRAKIGIAALRRTLASAGRT
jgi:sugar phosphate isomerase/epimerase